MSRRSNKSNDDLLARKPEGRTFGFQMQIAAQEDHGRSPCGDYFPATLYLKIEAIDYV
jgi:hypothetical protein